MAAQTQGAVDALLGLLTTAIKDEAKLIGGVPGHMQFIKDEMDSMNGFLKHLNKMEAGAHDDQIRAWMKQVREITYVAEDCVERYVHVVAPHFRGGGGCMGFVQLIGLFVFHPKTYLELHKLAKQLAGLKLRVREVGERRKRYDVSVPAGRAGPAAGAGADRRSEAEKEKAFGDALERALKEDLGGGGALLRGAVGLMLFPPAAGLPYFRSAMDLLPRTVVRSEAATVHGILRRCRSRLLPAGSTDEAAASAAFRCCMRLLLGALFLYPFATNQELKKLAKKLEEEEAGAGVPQPEGSRRHVMIFCYSLLSTPQKSCLQYLTAFLHEKEISRTSMVRRWVAEGLVVAGSSSSSKEQSALRTLEEEGERCFSELRFRGFILPRRYSDGDTVKSCVMEVPVRDFILSITESENFVAELPAHLKRQLKIRKIVQAAWRPSLPPPPAPLHLRLQRAACRCMRNAVCAPCKLSRPSSSEVDDDADDVGAAAATAADDKDPMDKLVDFLSSLPRLYRLNVLDLGGCRGIRQRHLECLSEVQWLKYLSLRNTDVSRLHARSHINKLKLLETLDIRETSIPASDTRAIDLPNLKHLLASRYRRGSPSAPPKLFPVDMPRRIGSSMRRMETLSQVQVSRGGVELEGVVRLHRLRKLGVVVHGNDPTAVYLGRVLYVLAECLRSLSIWVAPQTQAAGGDHLDISFSMAAAESRMVLENLDIKGKISSLPPWISKAQKLANVTLRDTEISGVEALRRLGSILSLRCLKLSRQAFTEPSLVFKDEGQFTALKFLVIEGNDAITRVVFAAADAAPVLEKIVWDIGGVRSSGNMMLRGGGDGVNLNLISGINNLPRLELIELRGDFNFTALSAWVDATPALRNPRYRCCFRSSSDANTSIDNKAPISDTTLSLPVRVINITL